MQRSTNFNNHVAGCDSVEQIFDLCARALYIRYYSTEFITTGIEADGSPIQSPKIDHWTGNQLTTENRAQEQTITNFVTGINLAYKHSLTPWLEVQPLGDPADTPSGIFAD